MWEFVQLKPYFDTVIQTVKAAGLREERQEIVSTVSFRAYGRVQPSPENRAFFIPVIVCCVFIIAVIRSKSEELAELMTMILRLYRVE
jgi:hypothetical protein